jgi:hypothetical protein
MAYYKINPTGCNERNGLVQVRFDCYLDEKDPGYAEHRVTVPIIPKEGYLGKVNDMGAPADMEDYEKWLASLPTETKDNPFCCHFRYFEPDITDADLLKAGESILAMAKVNHTKGTLSKNSNPPVVFTTNLVKIQASLSRVDSVKATDFSKVSVLDRKVRA